MDCSYEKPPSHRLSIDESHLPACAAKRVVSLVSVVSWKSLTKPLFYFSLEVFWLQNLIPHHQELDFRNLCPKNSYAYRFNSDCYGIL